MKRVLKNWPILFMIAACIITLIVGSLLEYTNKLDAYDVYDVGFGCYLGILPIGAFLTSICYGIFHGGFKKIWIIPICGLLYFIVYVIDNLPDEISFLSIEGTLICLQASMLAVIFATAGLLLGSLLRLLSRGIGKLMQKDGKNADRETSYRS